MIKKYIRGVQGRGNEVIEELEKLGGKNIYSYDGNITINLYYIDDISMGIFAANPISVFGRLIIEFFEEIHLPPVFVPKTFTLTFETALKSIDCDGCYFKAFSECTSTGLPSCIKNRIIYKLKKQ